MLFVKNTSIFKKQKHVSDFVIVVFIYIWEKENTFYKAMCYKESIFMVPASLTIFTQMLSLVFLSFSSCICCPTLLSAGGTRSFWTSCCVMVVASGWAWLFADFWR